MRRYKHIVQTVLLFFSLLFFEGIVAKAVTAEEMREKWRETADYPVHLLDSEYEKKGYGTPKLSDEWQHATKDLGAMGVTYALNPPQDVLEKMSSTQLADLMQTWPWIHLVSTYNSDGEHYDMFFRYAELNSDIFYELLGREDGFICLMEAYRKNPFSVEKNNQDFNFILSLDLVEKAEIFGCQFIRYYHQSFTQEEYELACEIIEEKLAIYEQLNAKTRNWLNLTEIDAPDGTTKEGIRANYCLSPEDRQDVWDSWLETQKLAESLETTKPPEQTSDPQVALEPHGQANDSEMTAEHKEEGTLAKTVLFVIVIVGVCAGILIFRKWKKHKA